MTPAASSFGIAAAVATFAAAYLTDVSENVQAFKPYFQLPRPVFVLLPDVIPSFAPFLPSSFLTLHFLICSLSLLYFVNRAWFLIRSSWASPFPEAALALFSLFGVPLSGLSETF